MSRRPFSLRPEILESLSTNQAVQQDVLRVPGIHLRSFGPSLARTLTKSVQLASQNCTINNFCRQQAPPGKVKFSSSAASDLKTSHRLQQKLNRGELTSEFATIDPVGVTGT